MQNESTELKLSKKEIIGFIIFLTAFIIGGIFDSQILEKINL